MSKKFRLFAAGARRGARARHGRLRLDDDDDSGGDGGGGGRPAESGEPIKAGVVTDIGGLNDRSFNCARQQGPASDAAEGARGRDARAVSESNGDYVPNLTTLAQQQFDLIVPVGFLMADATQHGREQVPRLELRDRRLLGDRAQGQAEERRGPAVRGAGGRLPRRLPRGPVGEGQRRQGDLVGGRPEDPAGRPLHRGLPGRRQEGQSRDPDAQRLLAGLRRPGQVQGDRARPDRQGLEGRLPGGRRLRPRRARRGQGEGRPGHRRRRRPVLPRRRTS